MEIYKCYTTKLQTLREEKEDEEDRKKITIIIVIKNNDIWNTGILILILVTSNSNAIYGFLGRLPFPALLASWKKTWASCLFKLSD